MLARFKRYEDGAVDDLITVRIVAPKLTHCAQVESLFSAELATKRDDLEKAHLLPTSL